LHSVARLRDNRQDEKELRPVIGTAICLRSRANTQSGHEAASGIAAANAILKTLNLEPFVHHHRMKNYVRIVPHPYTRDQLYSDWPEDEKAAAREANRCQLCERPGCMVAFALDIRGIMRRVAVGNFMGAKRIVDRFYAQRRVEEEDWLEAEKRCVRNDWHEPPVAIRMIIAYLRGQR